MAAVVSVALAVGFFAPALAATNFSTTTIAPNQQVGEPRIFTDPTSKGAKFFTIAPGADAKGNINSLMWWSNDGLKWSGPALTNQAGGGNDSDIAIDAAHTVYAADLSGPDGAASIPISVWNPTTHAFKRAGFAAPGATGLDRQWIASPSTRSVVAIALNDAGQELFWVSTDGAAHFTKAATIDSSVSIAGPLVTGKAASGHPAPLYFTYLKSGSSNSACASDMRLAKSVDGGRHWSTSRIAASQDSVLFPAVASDSAGGLYAAWSGCDTASGNLNLIMFSASHDGGKTWSKAKAVSDTTQDALGDTPVAVFPWIVAGNPGRVDITYAIQNEPVLNSLEGPDLGGPEATWDLRVAQSVNASSSKPTFSTAMLRADFHDGSICSLGTGCLGPQTLLGLLNVPTPLDRRDLDFFGSALDASGRLYLPYCADRSATTGDPNDVLFANIDVSLARQVGGTTLGSSGR